MGIKRLQSYSIEHLALVCQIAEILINFLSDFLHTAEHLLRAFTADLQEDLFSLTRNLSFISK